MNEVDDCGAADAAESSWSKKCFKFRNRPVRCEAFSLRVEKYDVILNTRVKDFSRRQKHNPFAPARRKLGRRPGSQLRQDTSQ